jgi:hypothetical protein
MSPPWLWPLTDYTTNYIFVLSSERAPKDEEQSNFPPKERKKEKFGHGPQRGARHQDILIAWLSVIKELRTLTTRPRRRRPISSTHAKNVYGKCAKDKNVNMSSNVHRDKWLDCDLQRTDPASRQRGRPTETGQQIPDPDSRKGSNIWSKVHKVDSIPRHIDWLTVSRKVTLTLWQTSDTELHALPINPDDGHGGHLRHVGVQPNTDTAHWRNFLDGNSHTLSLYTQHDAKH